MPVRVSRLFNLDGVKTYPYKNLTETVRFPGSKWHCSLNFTNLTDEESRELEVLMASLDGESGRVVV